jgi:glucose/arabinose dehydrogenase
MKGKKLKKSREHSAMSTQGTQTCVAATMAITVPAQSGFCSNGLRVFRRFLLAITLSLAAQVPALGQSWPQISFGDPIGGFNQPTHVATAGDGSGRLFVTERAGVIRIVRNGVVLPTPFLDITGRPGTQGSQGLLSVAFPPAYASRQHFYVNYVASNTVVVARYRLTADPNVADPNSEQVVLTIGPFATNSSHFGGELAFGPDGYLYLGVGTGSGAAPDNLGQDLTVLRGKLLRIDVESGNPATYTIPPSNPFVGNPNARPEIWALGVRNHGVRLSIGRRAIITSPMLDKRRGKKWMFSWRVAPAVPITAGTSWKELCVLMLRLATAPVSHCR